MREEREGKVQVHFRFFSLIIVASSRKIVASGQRACQSQSVLFWHSKTMDNAKRLLKQLAVKAGIFVKVFETDKVCVLKETKTKNFKGQ